MSNILLIPIVAKSAFKKDFNLSDLEADYYYKEQCAMKQLFGIKSIIKFINNE